MLRQRRMDTRSRRRFLFLPSSNSSPSVGVGVNLSSVVACQVRQAGRQPGLHAANGEHRGPVVCTGTPNRAASKRRMGCGSISIHRGLPRASRILRQISKWPSSKPGKPQEKCGFPLRSFRFAGADSTYLRRPPFVERNPLAPRSLDRAVDSSSISNLNLRHLTRGRSPLPQERFDGCQRFGRK